MGLNVGELMIGLGLDTAKFDAKSKTMETDAKATGKKVGSNVEEGAEEGVSGLGEGLSSAMDAAGIPMGMKGAAVGALVGAAVLAAVLGALDEQKLGGQLAARLNLDPQQALNAGRMVGDLWAQGFGDSKEQVMEAADAVWSSLADSHKSQAAWEDMTKRALTFASVMGLDVVESTKIARVLIQNGLAKDGVEAFDMLSAAAQAMPADMRQELIPIVDEYAVHLAGAGFTGEQAMALIANAAKGGTYEIDKTVDAIKEFTLKAGNISDTGAQDALKSIGLNGNEVATALAKGGDEAQAMRNKVLDALLAVEDPAKRAEASVAIIGTQFEDLGGVANSSKVLGALRNVNGELTNTAGATVEISGANDRLAASYNNAGDQTETFKRRFTENTQAVADGWISMIANLGDNWSAFSETFPENFSSGMEEIKTDFIAGMGVIWGWLQGIGGAIIGHFGTVFGGAAAQIGWWLSVAKDWAGERISDIVSFVTGIPGRIGGVVSTLWDGIKGGISSAKDWVRDRISDIAGEVTGLPGRIGDMGRALWDAGKAVIQGFIDGIRAGFDRVKDTLGSLTDMLPDWKGPATLDRVILRDTGRMVIGGFVSGLEDEFPNVRATLGQLTGSLALSAQAGMAGASAGALGGGQTTNVGGVKVIAQTNADPHQIAAATAWKLKTAGV